MSKYIDVGKYTIKIDDFFTYRFSCNSRETKKCTKNKKCCCGIFFVDTTAKKVKRIFDIFDSISEFCPALKDGNKYVNPFEEDENNRYSVETKDDGYCIFSYFDKTAALKCAIHSAALKLDADPFFYKPLPCAIWPVTVFKEKDDRTIVCLDTETQSTCLKKKNNIDNTIDPALLKNLELLLGESLSRALQNAP
jgi:Protein of unknown function (DUF3109)